VAEVKALFVDGLLDAIGRIFMAALQMLVVPVVLVSLVCGTAALEHPRQLGRIGGKALALFLATTASALSLALLVAHAFQPGRGAELGDAQFVPKQAPPLRDVLVELVPANPVRALADGNTLQIIVFAILLGLAITLAGERGRRVRAFFEDLDGVVTQLVDIVMGLAPIGVFALVAKVGASFGPSAFFGLVTYFAVVLLSLALHMLGVYSLLLVTLARASPRRFFSKMREPIAFAFGTASSNATLPVNLRTVRDRLGVSQRTAAFVVPLGATVNMDGTAIMQGVATLFIANAYGISLDAADHVTIILMATLASIGTAGVPGVGLVMLAGVLTQVGLPVEGIGLVLGVDRLLDMARTAVNVTGDAVVSVVVASSEGELDRTCFDAP
jgi:Na+/H+-dicarboxylate symporter